MDYTDFNMLVDKVLIRNTGHLISAQKKHLNKVNVLFMFSIGTCWPVTDCTLGKLVENSLTTLNPRSSVSLGVRVRVTQLQPNAEQRCLRGLKEGGAKP